MNTERFARIDLDRSRFEKKECNHCLVYSEFCGVQSVMLGVSVGVTVKDLANVILSVKTLMCLTSTLTCVKVCIHRVSKYTPCLKENCANLFFAPCLSNTCQ